MGKNQSASNLTNIIKQDASGNITFVSGSTTLMSVSSSGAIATTGNVAGTASYASNAELLDGLDSTVFTLTSSFTAQTASFTAFTASVNSFTASQLVLNGTYATTGSNTFAGIQTINSNLVVTGSITAQTLVVQTVTSSIVYSSGSNVFGNNIANTHQFTGSLFVTGGLNVTTGSVGIGTINPQEILHITGSFPAIRIGGARTYLLQTVDTDGRFRIHDNTAGERFTIASGSGFVGIGTIAPAYTLDVSGSIRITGTTANALYLYGAATVKPYITINEFGVRDWKIGAGTTSSGKLSITATLAGTDGITIDGTGSIGIGTSSPSYKLDVVALGSPSARVRNGDLGGTATLLLETANNFSGTCQTFIQCVGSVGNGTSMLLFGTAGANGDSTATERLRITSTGASTFKVSSDSVFDTLTLFNTSQTSAGNRLRFQNGYGDLAGIRALQMDNGSLADDGQLELQTAQNASLGTRMTITNAGSIGAPSGTNIYNASDVRLKRNIETITDGLSKVSALRPIKFNWIEGFELTEENKDMFGFIAQEVQNAVPEAVENFGNNSVTVGEIVVDNPLRVNEKFIIPVLVKAIQELKAEIDELKNR